MFELIGYLASALTIASFMLSGEMRVRTVNLAASVLFAIYSAAIGSISMTTLNVVIVAVHVLKLAGKAPRTLSSPRMSLAYAGFSAGILISLAISNTMEAIEVFGFASSFVLLYAFMQDGEMKMRSLCFASCLMFTVYAVIIGAVPLIISNVVLACVHACKLFSLARKPASRIGAQH